MYCKENRELLHKYYTEIAKERMHPDGHHLGSFAYILHLNMKRILNQISMLENMWRKCSEE